MESTSAPSPLTLASSVANISNRETVGAGTYQSTIRAIPPLCDRILNLTRSMLQSMPEL